MRSNRKIWNWLSSKKRRELRDLILERKNKNCKSKRERKKPNKRGKSKKSSDVRDKKTLRDNSG